LNEAHNKELTAQIHNHQQVDDDTDRGHVSISQTRVMQ